ncbi:hypothetical protein J647_3742 [Acinetobacter baumannii 846928]|uniref:pPIWI-associating nuclease domain-containing protein n=1 Tax=Acinetobacter baumannii TaxID=470 RepID=UPI0004465770|nr:hypothetical protein [Acinetobacter baumannii]EXI35193.1 hypothetical protein J647_3742 [Acinetobacter baumannii 846928]
MIPKNKVNEFRKYLEGDFEKNLLDSAILNLENHHSLTFNNFAYAMREMLRILFHRLSPEKEIRKCSWYADLKEPNDKITRRQRYKYAIQGGIGEFLLKQFGLDKSIERACSTLLKQIDVLNSFTHIGEHTYNLSADDTKDRAIQCFDAVLKVVRLIKRVRNKLFRHIIEYLDKELFKATVMEYVEKIDMIARTASVNEIKASKYINMEIDSSKVSFTVTGDVFCLLEYGNKIDIERGDGWSCYMNFDFKAPVVIKIKQPFGRHMNIGKIDVNIDSFYQ